MSRRIACCLERITDVETIVVPNETQSRTVLLENNLIKEYQPRFNVRGSRMTRAIRRSP